MWYVVQVNTGSEEKIRSWCIAGIPPSVLKECFIPRSEEKRKIQGEWKKVQKILFPGYVFLVSDDEEKLYRYLKGIPRFTRMLGTGNEVVPLNEREVVYLKQFGGKEHIAQMSEGIIEGDRVKFLMGPLKGMEAFIKKIDRHKRKAYLELELFGRTQSVEMGLEIAVKKVADEPAAEDGQKPQQDIKAKEDPAAGSDENHRKGTEDV